MIDPDNYRSPPKSATQTGDSSSESENPLLHNEATFHSLRRQIHASFRRIGANTIWLAGGRFGNQVLMVVFTMLIARRMGETGLGAYATMAAILFIVNVLTTFGTDMLVMREVAAHRDFSLLAPSLLMQLILSSVFVGLIYLFARSLPNQSYQVVAALQLYILALFPMAFYTVFSAVLRGLEFMALYMWLNLMTAALQTSLVWWFIQPGSSLTTLSWVLLTVQMSAAILAGCFCLVKIPNFRHFWKFPSMRMHGLVTASGSLALIAVLKVLFQKITIILISLLEGASVTGWFSAASRVVEASQIGHVALLGALFPFMSYAYLRSGDLSPASRKTLSISWRLLLALGFFVTLTLFFLADPLIHFIYGQEFEPSVVALRMLAGLMIPFSINIYLSSSLVSARQEPQVLFTFITSLLILIGLNLWWIPLWGLPGACLATLISEIIQAGIFLYLTYSLPRKG